MATHSFEGGLGVLWEAHLPQLSNCSHFQSWIITMAKVLLLLWIEDFFWKLPAAFYFYYCLLLLKYKHVFSRIPPPPTLPSVTRVIMGWKSPEEGHKSLRVCGSDLLQWWWLLASQMKLYSQRKYRRRLLEWYSIEKHFVALSPSLYHGFILDWKNMNV